MNSYITINLKKLSLVFLFITFILTDVSFAAKTSDKKTQTKRTTIAKTAIAKNQKYQSTSKPIPKPIETSLVVDLNDGKILHARNAHKPIYPASLTKLMTLYITFEALNNGKLKLNQKLHVSKNAEAMKPSKLYLKSGEYITVQDAIYALIIRSANDVAVVLAENIAGSESKFANLMTSTAKKLGMRNSHFINASGWHHSRQKTTAADMAKLAIALKNHHPQYYPFFAKTNFTFRNKLIESHNKVTRNYQGAEGLKTGYTRHAGFNLVTTASRNGKSLVGVVTGSKNSAVRDQKMVTLLNSHFVSNTSNIKVSSNKIIKKSNKSKSRKTSSEI